MSAAQRLAHEGNAVLTIAYRDLLKLLRDRTRWVASFVFPLIFIGALGGSMAATLGGSVGFDYLLFIFTGVLGQTMFQSAALGVISLIEDRERDLSQEIFVSPISRYSIVFGKIVGESLVALAQAVPILALGVVFGFPITPLGAVLLLPALLVACMFGAAFGVIVMANIGSQRAANQIFPFLVFPQFFLAGVFTPIAGAPLWMEIASRLMPMRYAVDLVRGAFYLGNPEAPRVVLDAPVVNLTVMLAAFAVFLLIGTVLFVRSERNR